MVGTRPLPRPATRSTVRSFIKLPPSSGFQSLWGVAQYITAARSLRVQIGGERAPGNHGPSLFVQEGLSWPIPSDVEGARRHLATRLEFYRDEVLAGRLPVPATYNEHCNVGGHDLQTFMVSTCSTCRCPYCYLSNT